MRLTQAAFYAGAVLATTADAIQLLSRNGSPAVVGLDIQKNAVKPSVARDRLRRRASSKAVSQTLDNEGILYFANVSLGTPEQPLRLHIDTGSSDLWTNAASSSLCQRRGNCELAGTYDANASSSYSFVSGDFNISYVDGSAALGDYATDTLRIGGQDITNMQFGIGYRSTIPQGILGIGYTVNEVQVNRNDKPAYPNLPALMIQKGLIRSNAYSLWLDDLDSSTGVILFGGVDTDKFHGELQTLPIQKVYGSYSEFQIALTEVSIGSGGSTTSLNSGSLPSSALLDSGSTLTYLPDDIVSGIFSKYNVQYDSQAGQAYCDCSLGNSADTINFTFSSPVISVSMSELVIGSSAGAGADDSTTFSNGPSYCTFGIAPAGDTGTVLGDTFIRSAYVVYDLSNNQISLAQTNFNATTSNIIEIGTGSNSVPQASEVANPVTASGTNTGGARIGSPSGTVTVTGATTTPTSAANALSGSTIFAILTGLAGMAIVFAL